MEKLLDKITNIGVDFGIKILITIIVLIVGSKIIKIIEKQLKKDTKFSKFGDASVKSFLVSFVTISLKIVLLVTVFSIIGIPMTSLITIIGSCAVAIGLALQGGLSNIAGGLMILIFKPFKVGDYIESSGKSGTVKSIALFYTTITTPDNKVVQLPNGSLSNSNITNYTANKTRRVDIDLSVSYDSDIEKVKKIINKCVEKQELILKDEEVLIRLKSHGDNALIFTLRVWANTQDYWDVYFNLMEEIKVEL
jgi:Small-conductance mechanosensitive channel